MECTENVALGYSISVGAPYGIDDVIVIGSLPARCIVPLDNKKEDRNSVAITNNVLICFSFIFIIFFNFLYV